MRTSIEISLYADQEPEGYPDANTVGNHHLECYRDGDGPVQFAMGGRLGTSVRLLCTPAAARHFARMVLACAEDAP